MNKIQLRTMTIDDYPQVYALWMTIHGFAIRNIDDSQQGIARFLRRNPTTCVVAELNRQIVGAILCGHDGRRGCMYHVCVAEAHRKHGIGQQMVRFCLNALTAEGISKVNLIAFKTSEVGNRFWQGLGWTQRDDANYYDYTLNIENTTKINP